LPVQNAGAPAKQTSFSCALAPQPPSVNRHYKALSSVAKCQEIELVERLSARAARNENKGRIAMKPKSFALLATTALAATLAGPTAVRGRQAAPRIGIVAPCKRLFFVELISGASQP